MCKGGVPAPLLQGATQITAQQAPLQQHGPAEAVGEESVTEETGTVFDDGAGVLQGGIDDLEPLRLWDSLMTRYKITAQIDTALEAAEAAGDQDEASRLAQESMREVSFAVRALARLNHQDIRRKLEEFHQSLSSAVPVVPVTHSKDILSSFSPEFW